MPLPVGLADALIAADGAEAISHFASREAAKLNCTHGSWVVRYGCLGLVAAGIGIMAVAQNPHFGLARLCFIAAGVAGVGQLLWWGVHVDMPMPGRLIVVMILGAVIAGVAVEALRWVARGEAAGRVEASTEARDEPKPQSVAVPAAAAGKISSAVTAVTPPTSGLQIEPIKTGNDPLAQPTIPAPPASASQSEPLVISPEQARILTQEFFRMRKELAGIWVDRPMSGPVAPAWGTIMELLNRAGIEAVSDLQNPSSPDQTGIVICVPDPAHPSELAKQLRDVFGRAGIGTMYDVIADRQRLRPKDAPSLVIYVAPPPL